MKTNYKLLTLLLLALLCFSKSNYAQLINAAEYFWDTDPGEGNGSAMAAADGSFNNELEKVIIYTNLLPATGIHTFNVRVRDHANKWSKPFKTIVDITPSIVSKRQIKVSLAEYFWDTDPGNGNGIALIAFDGAYDEALETVMQSGIALPAVGVHTLNLRVRDAENKWGQSFKTIVEITPTLLSIRAIKITAAEYFWDTDPGQGNAGALLAFDGAFDEAVETVTKGGINLPAPGVHKFNVRARDAENKWGNVFSTIVEITPNLVTARTIKVTAAEYFFDTDPGAGNATPMLAFDGNYNSALETLKGGNIPSPVLMGKHILYLRAKSASGQWGNKFGLVVNMDIDIDNFVTDINGAAALCYNTVFNNTYISVAHSGNTYTWSITGGTITAGSGTNSVIVNWGFTGIHKLKLTECNALGTICSTDSILVSISPPTTQSVNNYICSGDSLFLQGAWRKAAGTYHDSLLSIGGCDSIVHTTLSLYPTYNLIAAAGFCTGQSVIVGGVTINQPGTITQHFSTIHGCDSTVVTTVTEYTVSIVNTNTNICAGDSIYLQGAYQHNPGTFTDLLISSHGCDSVVVTQLSIKQPSSSAQTAYICNGDSILLGGAYQTSANVYVDVILNSNNCDSTITTTLNIWPSYTDTVQAFISLGDSILLGGAYQNSPGYYNDTLFAAHSCDSIIVTSLSILISAANLNSNVLAPQIFPNPFQQSFSLKMHGNEKSRISISDVTGRTIFESETVERNIHMSTDDWLQGVYFIHIWQGEYSWMRKLVKVE